MENLEIIIVIKKQDMEGKNGLFFCFVLWFTHLNLLIWTRLFKRLDNAIHWINLYPGDNVVHFINTYPLNIAIYSLESVSRL